MYVPLHSIEPELNVWLATGQGHQYADRTQDRTQVSFASAMMANDVNATDTCVSKGACQRLSE